MAIVLKGIAIIAVSVVAYGLATTKNHITGDAHPFLALLLEIIALSIIF